MTREEKIKALTMRLDGCTYEEIGKEFGITTQGAYAVIAGALREKAPRRGRWVYPNLEVWMKEHGLSVSQMADESDIPYSTLLRLLAGENITKVTLDAVLRFTRMTYEECFYMPEE